MAIVDSIKTEVPIEYPKIKTLYERDPKTHKVIVGKFTLPEFEYLADCRWLVYEKIDGTNIRVHWDGEKVRFHGRTSRAQIPVSLLLALQDIFPPEKFSGTDPLCLYGEGYGCGIQKVGSGYLHASNNFILFDVRCGDWWLKEDAIARVADRLEINTAPLLQPNGSPLGAADEVCNGFKSLIADDMGGPHQAEGIVMRPEVQLSTRHGERIIAKLKTKDF